MEVRLGQRRKMAETTGPVNPAKALEDALLSKVYNGSKEQLERDLAPKIETANNRLQALRLLASEVSRVENPTEVSVTGYYLQTYQRSGFGGQDDRGFSSYLANKNGVVTIHFNNKSDLPSPKASGINTSEFGNPQTWSALKQIKNLLSGASYLNVNPGKTKFAPATREDIGASPWELALPLSTIRDELALWHGYVAAIFPVTPFQSSEALPILGKGGDANLRVGLSEEPADRKSGRMPRATHFVDITTETQLRGFLGPIFNETELMSDEGLRGIRQSIVGFPVLIFGRGLTPNNPNLSPTFKLRMTKSKIQLTNGLGAIVPFSED